MFRCRRAARWIDKRLGPGKKLIEPVKVQGEILDADHARNFLDCVKSRKSCNCDIETGHRSTSATLLGNIALRSNSVIEWDATQERVTNHSKANDLLVLPLPLALATGVTVNSPLTKGGSGFAETARGLSELPGCETLQDNPQGLRPLPPLLRGNFTQIALRTLAASR